MLKSETLNLHPSHSSYPGRKETPYWSFAVFLWRSALCSPSGVCVTLLPVSLDPGDIAKLLSLCGKAVIYKCHPGEPHDSYKQYSYGKSTFTVLSRPHSVILATRNWRQVDHVRAQKCGLGGRLLP